ncbi:hypothetical protein H4Q26_014213 [Puccinia striiformis f. sp. tritici PST-130]|nr:hypothetical protein H4Q26_014213 [Puccinia striiformis f. sp. tritici PST-130]
MPPGSVAMGGGKPEAGPVSNETNSSHVVSTFDLPYTTSLDGILRARLSPRELTGPLEMGHKVHKPAPILQLSSRIALKLALTSDTSEKPPLHLGSYLSSIDLGAWLLSSSDISIRYPVRVKMNLALISATVITLFGIFEGTDGAPTHEKHLERRVVVGIAPIKITTPPPRSRRLKRRSKFIHGSQAYVYTGEFE